MPKRNTKVVGTGEVNTILGTIIKPFCPSFKEFMKGHPSIKITAKNKLDLKQEIEVIFAEFYETNIQNHQINTDIILRNMEKDLDLIFEKIHDLELKQNLTFWELLKNAFRKII